MSEISREEAIQYLCGRYLVVASPINDGAEKCEHHNRVIDKAISDMKKLEKIEHIIYKTDGLAKYDSDIEAYAYRQIEQIVKEGAGE